MELTAQFYATAIFAVLLTGISKSGFGGALGGMAVPLIALTIPAPVAAAVMLPILIVMDILGLVIFKGKSDNKILLIILPGAALGIALGAITFYMVNQDILKVLIGLEAIIFSIDRFVKNKGNSKKMGASVTKGVFWSFISGFTSFTAHAGGPPILQYLLPQGLDRVRMVGTTIIYFSIVNFLKLFPYGMLGLVNMDFLKTSVSLIPFIPIGYWVGIKMLKDLRQDIFNHVITACLFVTGLRLIYDGVA